MSDPTDEFDRELRDIARAALADAEENVDVERDLVEMLRRADDPPIAMPTAARSPWLLIGAAAAVVGMLVGGIVLSSRNTGDETIRTATSDAPIVATTVTAAPSTESTDAPAATDVAPASTLGPSTTAARQSPDPGTISVDFADPPPLVEPVAFASIPLESSPNGIGVAVIADGVIVQQSNTSFVTLIGPTDDRITTLEVDEQLSFITGGPGGVFYGLGPPVLTDGAAVPSGIRFMAISIVGERAGEVVAETEVDLNRYLELPTGAFGLGPDGIIDRVSDQNATIMSYVDEQGEPISWNELDPPLIAWSAPAYRFEPSLISVADSNLAWQLDITRAPDNGGSYVGPNPPAPTTGGRVVYSEEIGSDLTPGQDFGPSSMPVVAVLEPDGSGYWVRLPDGWSIAASDVWGTILMRTRSGELELARLDDALATLAGPQSAEPGNDGELAVGVRCIGEYNCTQLATMADGRIVAYDPLGDTLTVLDSRGETIQDVIELANPIGPLRPWLVTVGPDDVAYVSVDQPNAGDPIRDLLAIPIFGDGAGVATKISTVDGSGDSDLVPTAAGLAIVGCCGFDPVRPLVDERTIPWLDRRGQETTSEGPTFRLELGEPRDTLIRIDKGVERARFETPLLAASPRGMPYLAATDDGGALMSIYSQLTGAAYLVRFRPGATAIVFQEPQDIWVELLEPSGTVVVREGDRFVRRTLEDVGPQVPETGVEFRTVAGHPIETCRDRTALALDDVTDVQTPWQVRGGPVGNDGLYIAVDDAFGRRLMTGCGTAALAVDPLAGEGWLVWPMDGATGVLLAEPQSRGFVAAPDWLGQPIAQLNVDGTVTTVEIFLMADDIELPIDIPGERRADEQVLVELIEQARANGTVTSGFGPALPS